MTDNELLNLLTKISVIGIYKLTGGATKIADIDKNIEKHSYYRPVLGVVQINRISILGGYSYKLDFNLSNDYLVGNSELTKDYNLQLLEWTFELPPIDRRVEHISEDHTGTLKIESTENVVEWLIRGKVSIKTSDSLISKLDLTKFYMTVMSEDVS